MTVSTMAPDRPRRTPRLSRAGGDAGPAAPVRIVHLGLGNFFRAHQAWYTDQAPRRRRVGDRRVHRPVGRARPTR